MMATNGTNSHKRRIADMTTDDVTVVPITTTVENRCIGLTWQNVTVAPNVITSKRKHIDTRLKKVYNAEGDPYAILKNVNGNVSSGQLLAIMGSSGAGKTTLLNVLTQRNVASVRVSGEILVNGRNIGSAIRNISAYVQQEDLFVGTLTVKEHLTFQASLRLDQRCTELERTQRVNEVLSELGLVKCCNTIIGVPGRVKGISGGEKKRLAFASEILTNPVFLFCDEPTSGLDSFMAMVVSVLKGMATNGRAIVCTIHQPSSNVFTYFDRAGYPCPLNYNPADHYVHTLAVIPGKENSSRRRIKTICDAYEGQQQTVLQKATIGETTTVHSASEWEELLLEQSKYKASWRTQFKVLLWRGWLGTIRDPLLIKVRLLQAIVISVILGLIYLQTEVCCSTVQNINGILFLFIGNMTFPYIFGTINVFCDEIPVFLREHYSKLYRVHIYYMSKVVAELPQYIIFPTIYTSILYWMAGLRPDASTFFIALGVMIVVANVGVSIGYCISTVTADVNLALIIAPVFLVPQMLFGGFFLNQESVPVYFSWLQYISIFKYSYEALVINEWSGIDVIPTCGAASNETCLSSGKEVLNSLNFKRDMLVANILILILLIVIIRLISFISLLARTYRKG